MTSENQGAPQRSARTEETSNTRTGPVVPAPSSDTHLAASPLWMGLAGIAAGVVVWALLFAVYPVFHVPPEISDLPSPPPIEMVEELEAATHRVNVKNSILAFALLGFVVGGALGQVEGIKRRLLKLGLLLPGIVGAAAGGLMGMLAGFLGQTTLQKVHDLAGADLVVHPLGRQITIDPMMQMIGVHALAWCLLGIGLGIAMSSPARRMQVSLLVVTGGVLGGLLTAIIYQPLAGIIFPLEVAEILIPRTAGIRLMWIVLGAGLISAFGALMGRASGGRKGNP